MTRLALLTAVLLAGCSAQPAAPQESNPRNVGMYPTISHATPSGGSDEAHQAEGRTLQASGQAPTLRGAPLDVPIPGAPGEVDALVGLRGGAPNLPGPSSSGGVAGLSPLTGTASWYHAKGDQAAVPWWKPGQDPVWAVVSRFADHRTYSVTVLITGFCQCLQGQPRARVIDLSDGAFRQLAPLSVGLIRVQVELTDAGPGLPQTSTEEGP